MFLGRAAPSSLARSKHLCLYTSPNGILVRYNMTSTSQGSIQPYCNNWDVVEITKTLKLKNGSKGDSNRAPLIKNPVFYRAPHIYQLSSWLQGLSIYLDSIKHIFYFS